MDDDHTSQRHAWHDAVGVCCGSDVVQRSTPHFARFPIRASVRHTFVDLHPTTSRDEEGISDSASQRCLVVVCFTSVVYSEHCVGAHYHVELHCSARVEFVGNVDGDLWNSSFVSLSSLGSLRETCNFKLWFQKYLLLKKMLLFIVCWFCFVYRSFEF